MTASYCALAPAADAIVTAVRNHGVFSLLPGGVSTEIPENPTLPYLWVEVNQTDDLGGYGSKPGAGAVPDLTVRLHLFQGAHAPLRKAQLLMAMVIAIFADPPVVAGYGAMGIFHESTITLPEQELRGAPVWEIVAQFRLLVEEQP